MADIPNSTDGQSTAAPAAGEGSGESFDSRTGDDAAGSDNSGEEGDGEEGDESGEDDFQDDGAEPPVRSKDYYIGLRHGKKSAKAEKKSDDDGEDDGDDLDPEDAEILNNALTKAVTPLAEKLAAQEDAKALSGFIDENPVFKPFKAKIERYMKHESRRHLPIETVAMEAVGAKTLMQLGAKLATRSAIKKGSSGSGPTGGGKRGGEPAKSVWDMTPEEFAEQQQKIRQKA